MKKVIFIGILIIIGIIIFIGYYPPFFPFIKYGFLSQPATKVVFDVENFSTSPDNFPIFLQEIENTVHEYWHKDARLALVSAFFVPETNEEVSSYGLEFFSDLHQGASKNLPSKLTVFYNANLIVEKLFTGEDKFFNLQYHEGKLANNQRLVATECIDPFPCQFLVRNISGEIKPSEIKISGKKAFEIALTKNPELTEKDYIYNGEPGWFGFLSIKEDIPVWTLLPLLKIDARSGEILE